MDKYGRNRPSRQVYKPHTGPIQWDGKRVIVTDWNGKARVFTDIVQGVAYAASLYKSKPKRVNWREDTTPANYGRPIVPIVWHSQRAKFSSGRATIKREG